MDNKTRSNQGKKKALIIAISDYDNLPKEKQLPFCKNDGEEIYQILQSQGYEIPDDWKLIGRITSDQIKRAIFDFFRRRANSGDTLLFYFSGHGIPDGYGSHYLATTDIDPDYPDDRGYAFSSIQERVRMSVAKRIITILDCCFSGAAGITMSGEEDIARSARSAMDRTFEEGDGKCVLASSLADQVSYKMKGEPYSLFTYCLLEGLKGAEGEAVNLEGYVTPYTLGNYVYDRITSIDRRQKPITKTQTSGDIVLAYYPQLRHEKELVRTARPKVLHTSPADAATGVLITSLISATFSEPMSPGTINSTTFTVWDADINNPIKKGHIIGTPIEGDVSLSSDGVTAIFDPNPDLEPGHKYIAEINGANDLEGNGLISIERWSFMTASANATMKKTG